MAEKVKVELLPDMPVDEDAFGGHKRVAAAIAELVENEDGGKAIALEGGWGSGKSSIVRMLETRFAKVKAQGHQDGDRSKDTRILVFDAWSHEGDPLRRVFLEELTDLCRREFVQGRKDHWEKRKKKEITGREVERNQTTTPVLKSKWPVLVVAFASLYPVAIVAMGALLRQNNPEAWILNLIVACVVISLGPFLALFLLFSYLCVIRSEDGLKTAGNLISLWSKKIDETVNTTAHESIGPTSIEFQKYFSDLVREYLAKPKRRLVIVLDNLDRVPESAAHMLWATLRLFADCCDNNQDWSKRVWFIVPYDRDAAATLWGNGGKAADVYDDSADADDTTKHEQQSTVGRTTPKPRSISAAFLDKTFQIRFVVPPLHIADWEEYLNAIVEKAMSGFGSVDERHRVYRLSEKFADEKNRPPSPRHLKLYVNDIGAILRQFEKPFPIDHLALYTILRRNGRDARLWITSGAFKNDSLVQVMPDDSFVTSLLCIYFGTDDTRRAVTLTLRGPLRQHLRSGEGEKLRELAQIPGFWNEAETELEKDLEADEVKQDIVIKTASALDTSRLHENAPPEYSHVIPAFARKVLESANWMELTKEAARAAEILLQIADSSDATSATFSRLVSGEPDMPSVASDSDAWASGTAKLVEVAKLLGHGVRIVVPGDSAQTINCLASMNKAHLGLDVLERVFCKCPVVEIQSAVAPTATEEWPEVKFAALKTLHSTPKVTVDWNDLLGPISTRLQADAFAVPEAKRLLEAFFDLGEREPNKVKAVSSQITKHASFYVHVEKWSKDAHAVAALVALQVLAGNVGREASEPETQGHAFLQSLFTSPDDKQDMVEAYLAIVITRPTMSLLSHTMGQRSPLAAFSKNILSRLAERQDAAVALPVKLYLEQFEVVKEQLGGAIAPLTKNLLTSSEFKRDLAKFEVNSVHAGAHSELIQADAYNDTAYRENVWEFLDTVDKETWEQHIWEMNDTYNLLVSCSSSGWTPSTQLEDAVENIGLRLCNGETPEVGFSDVRRLWSNVYKNLGENRRGTRARRIVDSLKTDAPINSLIRFFGEEGDDLAKAFAEGEGKSLVRQVAEPIIKSGNQELIAWLNKVLQHGQTFWHAAPDDDRGTCDQSLWKRVGSDDNDEVKALLVQIAQRLNLKKPDPEDEATATEGGEGMAPNADS